MPAGLIFRLSLLRQPNLSHRCENRWFEQFISMLRAKALVTTLTLQYGLWYLNQTGNTFRGTTLCFYCTVAGYTFTDALPQTFLRNVSKLFRGSESLLLSRFRQYFVVGMSVLLIVYSYRSRFHPLHIHIEVRPLLITAGHCARFGYEELEYLGGELKFN